MSIDYSKTKVPEEYKCTLCGATNCKLWRESYSFTPVTPLCVDCAGKDQKKDVSAMDKAGTMPSDLGGRTDTIGWNVPAVPHEDSGYWGYTSIPKAGRLWWERLPTRSKNVTEVGN
jgi:hypothetical protein